MILWIDSVPWSTCDRCHKRLYVMDEGREMLVYDLCQQCVNLLISKETHDEQ
jgi:hypothetical protein